MDTYGHGGDVFAYDAIRHDFSVNINPLGMPEPVKKAVCEHIDEYETYPDTNYRALRSAIAKMESIAPERIVCGNGAADLIYKLCFSNKPENVLVCAPGFSEYERAALLSGSKIRYHALDMENGFIMTDAIVDDINDQTDIVFLCSPNNPTGRLISTELIERSVEKASQCGSLLVLDECFLDFTDGKSAKYLMDKFSNLIILKAFTKIFSMAGLRLGYMLCSDTNLLKRAGDFGQCWSVSAAAQYAGVAACSLDGFVQKTRKLIARERDFLSEGMKKLGIHVFDSDTNYLLLKCDRPLKDLLIKKGILIRSCDNFKVLDQRFFRVAVRTRQENSILLKAMGESLQND